MSLHYAVLFAAASAPPPHFDKGRLDDGTIEIKRRDARRRARSKMYAV